MESKIVARKSQIESLERRYVSGNAELIVVSGRRRVGKTYLIDHVFEGRFCFKITGAYQESRRRQISNFIGEIRRRGMAIKKVPSDWWGAFECLRAYLESLPKGTRRLLFFDELPWLDTQKSGFLAAFEWFWNDYGASHDDVMLIACGSSSSWLHDKFFKNKGGLYNRHTEKIVLEPFTLRETEEYLSSKAVLWSRYDIAELYMILGGIPYYLSKIDGSLTLSENVDRLFFAKDAQLNGEFSHLLSSLFQKQEMHLKIIKAVASKRIGLSHTQIVEETGIPSNGALSKALEDLVDSGFLSQWRHKGDGRSELLYRLSDPFTAFHFRFLDKRIDLDERFWTNSYALPARNAWAGLSFETVCFSHLPQIKTALGISGILSEVFSWSSRGSEDGKPGAQIDLVLDRKDRVVNLVEIKFSTDAFAIDKDYDAALRRKITSFQAQETSRKSVQLTFLTTFGLEMNKYRNLVAKSLVLDDLFAF
ncbi:MAG: hypothetical protein J6038_04950 [Bacilli bacterium]|nr:hypothetical protein [Bacilli bacterium]